MRKIDKAISEAFWCGSQITVDNTSVIVRNDIVEVVLHGTAIVRRRGTRLQVSAGGHPSQTTRCRINAIIGSKGYGITQRDYVWYIRVSPTLGKSEKEPMSTKFGEWTLVDPGSDLEQIALASVSTTWD